MYLHGGVLTKALPLTRFVDFVEMALTQDPHSRVLLIEQHRLMGGPVDRLLFIPILLTFPS